MVRTDTPVLEAEPGWVETQRSDSRKNRSFVSGDPEGSRIRIRYWREGEGGPMVARVWFGPDAEGPPGHAHGGAQAAVLDELLGGNAWVHGHKVLAGTLQVVFRRPLPLRGVLTARAFPPEVEGRKVFLRGQLEDEGGVYAEGSGTFIVMRPELQARIFEAAEREGLATPDAY